MAAAAPQFPGQSRERRPLGQKNWARGRIRGAGFKWSSLACGSHERSLHTKEKCTHTHNTHTVHTRPHTHTQAWMQTQMDCLIRTLWTHTGNYKSFLQFPEKRKEGKTERQENGGKDRETIIFGWIGPLAGWWVFQMAERLACVCSCVWFSPVVPPSLPSLLVHPLNICPSILSFLPSSPHP